MRISYYFDCSYDTPAVQLLAWHRSSNLYGRLGAEEAYHSCTKLSDALATALL
jgi:hypothetical protein